MLSTPCELRTLYLDRCRSPLAGDSGSTDPTKSPASRLLPSANSDPSPSPVLGRLFDRFLVAFHQLEKQRRRILVAELIEFLQRQRQRRIDRFLLLFLVLVRTADFLHLLRW